jgi:aryl-alcohol dehydrogenase-like predicted oxidoreductase
MEHVRIPGIASPVSRIGLGTWAIGGWAWGGADDAESIRAIHRALDLGVNLVDTAPVYGFGRAEEVVGRALAGRRDRAVVATKLGLAWAGGKIRRDASPARVAVEVEDSLRRLGTDVLDLVQVHWPDPSVPFEDTAGALDRLVRAGKIRALGVSNHSPAQMDRFRRGAPLATSQPPYNVFERGAERDVLPYCRASDISVLAYGALCRGLLSGRIDERTAFPAGDIRNVDPKFRPPRRARYVAAVRALDALAHARWGVGVLELAVRWVLDAPGVSIALWGARRPSQLDPLPRAMAFALDAAARAEIAAVVDAHVSDAVGPEFMAPPGG